MILLKIALISVAVGIICRYVPGFKCITYCKFKTFKYNRAIKKLKKLAETPNANFDLFTRKQMIKLYDDSTPFGCKALFTDVDTVKIREKLKNAITDSILLED